MTRHFNPSIVTRAQRILNSKSGDYLSDEVAGPMAVIPISPRCDIVKTLTGSGNIFAVPNDKDFYLNTVAISMAKVVGDTGSVAQVVVTIAGVATSLIAIQGVTLTADSQTATLPFPVPIKVDRNTNITLTLTGAFTSVRGSITGYTEEVTSN